MTYHTEPTDRRAAIDQSIEHALPTDSTGCLAPAHAQMDAFEDRWYGRLVFASAAAGRPGDPASGDGSESVTGDATGSKVVDETGVPSSDESGSGSADVSAFAFDEAGTAGAAAIELLRGYCSLRYALLLRDTDEHSLESVTPQLLSSDYLFAAAFERLGGSVTSDGDTARLESCFETLAGTAERSIEAMATYERQSPSPDASADLIEETAGALGWWAARTGAVLAGVPTGHRQVIASIGRTASAHRQLRHIIDPSTVPGPLTPFPGIDRADLALERDELRRQTQRYRDETMSAIASLPSVVDTPSLRSLVRIDR